MQEKPEIKDIQGIVIRGYKNLTAAHFLLLTIQDAELAKKWLSSIMPEITSGDKKDGADNDSDKNKIKTGLNIAFTFEGLKALRLDQTILDSFPLELQDGMTTKHKQQFLGDFADSNPNNWEWGGTLNEQVHIMLMVYATNPTLLSTKISALLEKFTTSASTCKCATASEGRSKCVVTNGC